ncbi:hypothetical protein [Actinomadura rudentiformis]|uniref:Uncharacterized protein n=1 Tax=Actinomadura rudentiformis TaxID=359158 RepID=A0A6H9YPT9_9ACTN|nr:hypothetical protein [Actinomadura rudentiformis]KAB2344851.1 hypothetical protein F8566_30125 [Actinomadura rudentiformis]
MAITTLGEAHAVIHLIRFLLDDHGDNDKAREGLALLAESARKRLQTGYSAEAVTKNWHPSNIAWKLVEVGYADNDTELFADLQEHRQVAASYLNRGWFNSHVGRTLTDEEWALIVPRLYRYSAEIGESWANERFADEILDALLIHRHTEEVDPSGIGAESEPEAPDEASAKVPQPEAEHAPEKADAEEDGGENEDPRNDEPKTGAEDAAAPEPKTANALDEPEPEAEVQEEAEEVDPPAPDEEVDLPPDGEDIDEAPAA